MRDRNHTYGSSQSNLSIYEHLRYLASSTSSLSCLVCYLVAILLVPCNDHVNTACVANTRPAWNEKCTMVVLYTCHDYRCINSVNISFKRCLEYLRTLRWRTLTRRTRQGQGVLIGNKSVGAHQKHPRVEGVSDLLRMTTWRSSITLRRPASP